MYDSRDIAAYIAQQCNGKKIDFNNTKMQKLLYCAYGCLLAWTGERICNEYPRAWKFGPVFPKVFTYIHRGNDIAEYSTAVRDASDEDAGRIREIIGKVLEVFGDYTAGWLSAWSHKKGSPWYRAVYGDDVDDGAGLNGFIPDGYIAEYFKDKVLRNA